MDKILKVHTVNDYARYIGAPELHPLVSVIHYDELEHCRHSLNRLKLFASLAKNYFGDLIRELTGKSATSHIHRFIMQRSQALLLSGKTLSETAESLGFEYPQHFTRQFKKFFGITPTEFLNK